MPRWSLLRLSMITSITFILDPPLGRYSSGTCVMLLAKLPHPAAPRMVAPASPAPATFRKSLRVRVRSFTPHLLIRAGKQGLRAPPERHASVEQRASSCPSTRPSLPNRTSRRRLTRRCSLLYRSVALGRSPEPLLACAYQEVRGEGAHPHAQGLSQGGRCWSRRGYHPRRGRVRQLGQQHYTSARRVPSERGI